MERKGKQELEDARKQLAIKLDQFVNVLGELLEPLKKLDDYQMAALATLGFSIRAVMLAGRPACKTKKATLARFGRVIDELCPPLGKVIISKDPCLDASSSYAEELKRCEDKGKSEAECPKAWVSGGQAVACTMKEVQDMKRNLADIFGRLKPPKPTPWPDM